MNKWKAFVAGQVLRQSSARSDIQMEAPKPGNDGKVRARRWGKNDVRAKRKRIARRRARKGYK